MTDTPQAPAETRDRLTDYEQMQDAQKQCVPCALCGGKAVISDAGAGMGYYINCSNYSSFQSSRGCMIDQQRLGGWAYNVMDWWNRLHAAALTRHAGGDDAEIVRLRGLLVDPGSPPWEDARAVLVAELRKEGLDTHADNVAAAHGIQIPSHIALNLIAHARRAGSDAILAGMKPWHGGDGPPADWDGGPVLRRHGGLSMPGGEFAWASQGGGLGNVVAYTAKAPAKPDYETAWREMHDALSWMQGNCQLHAYLGWDLAAIANDLIDRAYPGLRNGSAALNDRPTDEDIDPYLPDHLQAEKRLGVQRSVWLTSWFIPWSPRNGNENAEGPWSHWVAFAHAIIEADNAARAKLAADKDVSA